MTSSRSSADPVLLRHVYSTQAGALVAAVDRDPWGSVRASAYETARVLSLAPWLPGHERRLAWVLEQQAADGSWGEGSAPYRLLPTLSAVEALLSQLRDDASSGKQRTPHAAAAAAAGGLGALSTLAPAGPWPDTAAIEILAPSLFTQINDHLDQPMISAVGRLGPWTRGPRLTVPQAFQGQLPEQLARRCRSTGEVPAKFHHTYEGLSRHLAPAEAPVVPGGGLLGSSPAATAARAATSQAPQDEATTVLMEVARRYDGLFPEAAPVTTFERLWVAAALAGPGLPDACLTTVRGWAGTIYDPAGVRGAPGLLPDADDTAMAVLVAALAGQPRDPAPLAAFEAGTHYDCYVGEDTGSATANAHALQALHAYLQHRPAAGTLHHPRMGVTRDWLLAQQQSDGFWIDKWHASPYYATERCVTALAPYRGSRVVSALRAAADWVLASQRGDGSWGIWSGTVEETAYAVKILLRCPDAVRRPQVDWALIQAEAVLHAANYAAGHRHPALWHDKTLYAPEAMIQAEVMTSLELLRSHRGCGDRRGSNL
ncbi:prenyltransferase [Streptomyces sp. NPDC090493]|uniref:prenyltransferase n=1 Tax=Streptomyces sp. NPDC090493 TaxID=3365964 RepID=UPI0038267E71